MHLDPFSVSASSLKRMRIPSEERMLQGGELIAPTSLHPIVELISFSFPYLVQSMGMIH